MKHLHPRQLQCAELLGQGLTPKEIAGRFGISRTVVDGHIDKARKKLGLKTTIALAVAMCEVRVGRKTKESQP